MKLFPGMDDQDTSSFLFGNENMKLFPGMDDQDTSSFLFGNKKHEVISRHGRSGHQ